MTAPVRQVVRLTALGALALGLALPTGGAQAVPAVSSTPSPGASASLQATASGDPQEVGEWRVVSHGDGDFTVRWTSPTPLPVTDDRAVFTQDGADVAVPTLDADGRTLSIEVSLPDDAPPPETDDIDVMLSGKVLDAATPLVPAGHAIINPLPGTTTLTPDPGVRGSHPVTSSTYELPGVKMPGMPGDIEMLGHVVRPSDATAGAPVVVFLHGRHEACYESDNPTGSGQQEWPCPSGTSPVPSYLGYVYVQNLLASQGYVTVSISANGINAQDYRLIDGGAAARARLISQHLRAWSNPAYAADIGPAVTADLDNVVLVGHSRGGEGANRASAAAPLNAPYRISGQVLVGPTDFGRQAAPYVPTVTVLPYCDGDVSDLQGQTFTDLPRDFAAADTALHSSLLVMGANHNFFNTEWTPGRSQAPSFDDWFSDPDDTCGKASDSRLTAKEQRKVGRGYIAGAVRFMTDGDAAMLPLFDGSRVSLASAGDTDVRSHAVGLGRQLRAPGRGAHLAAGTATTQFCLGRSDPRDHARWCGRRTYPSRTPHWPGTYPPGAPIKRAFEMSWDQVGQDGGLTFAQPIDLTGRTLHLRTIVAPAGGTAELAVRIRDAGGNTATVDAPDLPSLPTGEFVLGKRWAQDLAVDGSAFGPGVDLGTVTGVWLVSRNAKGRVWVLDVAAGGPTPPPVPGQRAGRLRLSNLTIPEGDATGTQLAQLPFHIDGDVSVPTAFRVAPAGFFGSGSGVIADVHVPAGTRSGTIAVPYEANQLDDLDRIEIDVAAYGVSGAMPTDYIGRVRILDDDPPPTISVEPRRATVREGWVARWTVRLSQPVNYYDTAIGQVLAGPTRTDGLRADDVTRAWLRDHLFRDVDAGHRRLDNLPLRLVAEVRPGQRFVTFAIPTVHDRRVEGLEHATLRVQLDRGGQAGRSSIRVQD